MYAWLIINEFLHAKKFNEIHQWLLKAATKQGIDIRLKTNAELLVKLGFQQQSKITELCDKKPEFVIFWDKDIRLAEALEMQGLKVYNSAQAIEVCDDKSLTHLLLSKEGVPMPKTILAPMTYVNIGYSNFNFLDKVECELGYPIVVKECFGSFGQQVYLCHNRNELLQKVQNLQGSAILFQEFVHSSFAKDIRIQVVGNEVVASMYRYSDTGDFRANITNGGQMKPYEPTKQQAELALKCCKVLGVDFAGVDILFGENGNDLVCEVNSNAHFKNIFDCTGVNTADKIVEYIVNKA